MEKEKHVAKTRGNLALEPENQNKFKKNNKKIKSNSKEIKEKGSGVVYLGHLPHGFYEEQIKKYMSQFGRVKAVKVSRSIKTGKSKGYAFVQFHSDEVAKVVADTMDNYLVFERLVKCQYIPSSKLHPRTMGRRSGVFKPPKAHIVSRDRHNNIKRELKQEKTIKRQLKKHKKKTELLKSLGIDLKLNKLENALSEGRKILEEKEKERAASCKSETESEVESSTKKPVKETKTPLSGRKLKMATSKSRDKVETRETPREQVTPAVTQKTKKRKGTPAEKRATGETTKTTSATTPAKAKATSVHKVTPMVQKKKSRISESFNSSQDQSMEMLIEDSEEEEISFKTPPRSIRSSKTPTLSAAAKKKRAMSAKKSTPAGRPQKKRRSV